MILSLYEGASCVNVEQGRPVGGFPSFRLVPDVFEAEIDNCATPRYVLEEAFQGTSLQTDLYPDLQLLTNGLSDENPLTMVMFPSRDLSCSTQPRSLNSPFPLLLSEGPDEVICQDVENGFVLYCLGGTGQLSSQPVSCRNQQEFIQGTLEMFPLSARERYNAQVNNITETLNRFNTPPPPPPPRRGGRRGRRGR